MEVAITHKSDSESFLEALQEVLEQDKKPLRLYLTIGIITNFLIN